MYKKNPIFLNKNRKLALIDNTFRFFQFLDFFVKLFNRKLRIRDFKRINYLVIPYTTEPCSSLFVERNF
jgi:hypothetical protein